MKFPHGPDAVSQSELLGAYKDLVDSNKQAADKAAGTMDLVMKLASCSVALVAAFTALLGVIGAKNFFDTQRATLSVKRIEQSAATTEQKIEQLEKRAENLQGDLTTLRQDTDADLAVVERLHALDSVDRYAMNLFGDDADKRMAARKGLLERVKSHDPIVRRECIRIFAEMPKYVENWSAEEEVLFQLKSLAEEDKEDGVRKEAERALSVWLQGTTPGAQPQ